MPCHFTLLVPHLSMPFFLGDVVFMSAHTAEVRINYIKLNCTQRFILYMSMGKTNVFMTKLVYL